MSGLVEIRASLDKVITEILPPAHPHRKREGKIHRKTIKRHQVLAHIRLLCAMDPTNTASRLNRVKGNIQWPDKYPQSDLYLVLFAMGFGNISDADLIKKFTTKKQSIIFALETYYNQQQKSVEKLMWRVAKEANSDKPV